MDIVSHIDSIATANSAWLYSCTYISPDAWLVVRLVARLAVCLAVRLAVCLAVIVCGWCCSGVSLHCDLVDRTVPSC